MQGPISRRHSTGCYCLHAYIRTVLLAADHSLAARDEPARHRSISSIDRVDLFFFIRSPHLASGFWLLARRAAQPAASRANRIGCSTGGSGQPTSEWKPDVAPNTLRNIYSSLQGALYICSNLKNLLSSSFRLFLLLLCN